jgi:hypothetical protein
MTFLIIETFKKDKIKIVYEKVAEKGRMLPEGLKYIDSWVDMNLTKCYQIMTCDDEKKLKEWILKWDDLVDFEIIPVLTSKEASEKVHRLI